MLRNSKKNGWNTQDDSFLQTKYDGLQIMYVKTKQNMKFNNDTIREAVNEWLDNEELAEKKYGHISSWDVSNVTNMSKMFKGSNSFQETTKNSHK